MSAHADTRRDAGRYRSAASPCAWSIGHADDMPRPFSRRRLMLGLSRWASMRAAHAGFDRLFRRPGAEYFTGRIRKPVASDIDARHADAASHCSTAGAGGAGDVAAAAGRRWPGARCAAG